MTTRTTFHIAIALTGAVALTLAGCDGHQPTHSMIALSSASQTFSAEVGGPNPSNRTVDVTNAGDGTLGALIATTVYQGGQPTGWMTASLSSTTAPSVLLLSPAIGSLPAGTYNAAVAVASGVAGNSPQTLQVVFTVAPAAQADLVISAPATLTVSPGSVAAGGLVNLPGWTVRNQGTAPAGDFSSGFYLSTDATITSADVLLDGNSNTGLAVGAAFDWAGPALEIPAGTAPGPYFIGILVDRAGEVDEANEGNNLKSVALAVTAPPQPDLVISAPATLTVSPGSVAAGGLVDLPAWTVRNQGTGASGAFSNGFYLSTDAIITAADLLLDGNSNIGLAAGASFGWGSPAVEIPAGTAPGSYFIGILVDRDAAVNESDEANNFKSVALTVTVPVQPDLVISAPPTLAVSPATVAPGGSVDLPAWTVRNQGSGASGDFSNGFYLSTNAVITAADLLLDGNSNTGLAAGSSFAWGGPSLEIPAGTAPGSYFIGVLVDRANAVDETNEANNYKSVALTVVPTPLADLVISAPATLTASPSSTVPGGSVTLPAWTVRNQGSGASGDFSNGFYLSIDATITSADVYLDGNSNTGLAAGSSFNWGGPTLTIPEGTAPGSYYIGILVDRGNGVAEANEGNNYKSAPLTVVGVVPDLVISAPATLTLSPTSVPAGGSVTLSAWTVRNQGTGASGDFSNGFYLSTDANITAADVYLTGNSNTGLAPGASFNWGGPTLTIPAATAPGSYFVGILVDRTGAVVESNEANNFKSVAVTVLPRLQPDLVISAPGALAVSPSSVPAGSSVTLSAWTVANQGTSVGGGFSNGFYLSTDATITSGDVYLDGNSNSGLGAGASFNWGGPTLTIPAGTAPGSYYIGILVDRTGAVAESNEGNNFKSVAVTVLPPARPDLVISAPASLGASPNVAVPGGAVTLSAWTVRNQGTAASGAFSNGFYLSTDATITAADVYLTGNSNSGLAAGAAFNWGGPTLTIPAGTAPGSYYIGILVDRTGAVVESNESNNFKSVAITVVGPVLRYAFDGNANNSGSLAGYNGSATNVTYVPGKFGSAIKFDGSASTGATLTGTSAVFATGTKWTISIWFKEDVQRASSRLWDFRGPTAGWHTYHGVTPTLMTTCSDGGCFSFTPAAGVWHNIVYRYDGVSATVGAPVQIFFDGIAVGSLANTTALVLLPGSVPNIRIGNSNAGSSPSVFYVDDFRVYDRVFSLDDQCRIVTGGSWTGAACTLP